MEHPSSYKCSFCFHMKERLSSSPAPPAQPLPHL
jgi:hypothetical protein